MMVSAAVLGADLAAGDRRVEVVAAELVDPLARTPWSRSARSSSCRPRSCPATGPRRRRSRRTAPSSTCGVSGTMVMMMSAFCATSCPLAQTTAPLSVECLRDLPRVWTNSSCPPSIRCPAIGAPMMPRPMNPTSLMMMYPVRCGVGNAVIYGALVRLRRCL